LILAKNEASREAGMIMMANQKKVVEGNHLFVILYKETEEINTML